MPLKAAIALLLSVVCGGCVGTADSIAVIRGQLVLKNGAEVAGCSAVPYLSGSREPFSKYERTVDSRFFVSLVNAPASGTAFVEFKCPGAPGVVRTGAISLKEASEPNGIDVGRIVVDK